MLVEVTAVLCRRRESARNSTDEACLVKMSLSNDYNELIETPQRHSRISSNYCSIALIPNASE